MVWERMSCTSLLQDGPSPPPQDSSYYHPGEPTPREIRDPRHRNHTRKTLRKRWETRGKGSRQSGQQGTDAFRLLGGRGEMEGRVWATLMFLSLPLSAPACKHPAWGEGTEERVLDKRDPTWPRTWALEGLGIPAWRVGQRRVLRKPGFSPPSSQEHGCTLSRNAGGGGGRGWELGGAGELRGAPGSFPQESTQAETA